MFSFFRGKPAAVQDSLPTPTNSPPRGSSLGPPATPSPQPEPQLDLGGDSSTSPSADIAAFRTLVSSVPAKIVHQYILARLKDDEDELSPECLTQVALFFKDLTAPKLLHCARCHHNYFAVENNDRACRVQHDDKSAEVSRAAGGLSAKGHSYETLWGCCGKTVEGDGDMGPPDGWCYEGTHTTDHKRARFRADSEPFPGDDKLISCEKKRCKDTGVPSKRRPGRKRARMVSYHDASDHELGMDVEDDNEEEETRSVKSTSTRGGGGRKRRKLSPAPDTPEADGMDVDGGSVASTSTTQSRPKGKSPTTKPRSVSGSSAKPRSRLGASAPIVPPLPVAVDADASPTTSPAKVKNTPKPKAKSTREPAFTVAASGEEAEAEDTEPSPSVKKKAARKKTSASVDLEEDGAAGEKVKKQRKKKNADGDDAAYVDDAHAIHTEDEDIVVDKRKKKRKSAAADAMVIDEEPTRKKAKAKPKANASVSDAEEENVVEKPVVKPRKSKKKLVDVVQSSIPGEEALA